MVQVTSFYYDSANGRSRIHCVKWENTAKKPRAVLQIAHGIADYIMRYDDFARFLAEKGIIVVGNDHAGHGKSITGGDKGFFAEENGWESTVADIKTLHDMAKAEYPDLPYIALGHSMGSFLIRTYIIDRPDDFDACVFSGTGNHSAALCDAGIAIAKLAVKKSGKQGRMRSLDRLMFGTYNKHINNPKTGYDWVSRDAKMVANYVKDPLCAFVPTNGMIIDMLGGMKYITNEDNAKKMRKTMPVYFFSGSDDPVGEYEKGVRRACSLFLDAGMQDVSFKIYPGGRHEMLNEINKQEVYEDTLKWIESKL